MAVSLASQTALRAVAERILADKEAIVRRTLDRFAEQLVGWQVVDEEVVEAAHKFMLCNVEVFVRGLEHGEPVSEDLLASARDVAARRFHQGVTFEGLMRAGRLAGETLWEAVLAAAHPERPEEREAALAISGRVWRHFDAVATVMAHAYLDEMTDRGLLGHDLLDALLAGRGEEETVRRIARVLHRRLADSYVVVLVRFEQPLEDGAWRHDRAVDHMLPAVRAALSPNGASLLIGIRQGDVVALRPTAGPGDLETVRRECEQINRSVPFEVSIGMSGWQRGRRAVATAYAEAREAVEIAAGIGIRGRAVTLDDVLVDHMLRASPHARRILERTLRPLVDYDSAHHSNLVPTLRAYLDTGANLTRSAAALRVHPNTVVYRLRRIAKLSGRSPSSMSDLQILFLALRLRDLSTGAE
jgi:sugar diacid utilization regulator